MAFALSLLSLALCLSFSAAFQDSELGVLAEKYFQFYATKNLDGVTSLFSEKSPDYASLKTDLQRQFSSEDSTFTPPRFSHIKSDADHGYIRATTNQTAVNLKSDESRQQRLIRNFEFVKENGKWKIWRTAKAEADLADALARATTDAQRKALLTDERELFNGDLVEALLEKGSFCGLKDNMLNHSPF